jgi:chemotaxis protein MotB
MKTAMMRGVVRVGLLVAASGFASGLGGCVNQGEYDRLYEANNSMRAQLADLTRERDEARLSLDQMRGGINRGEGTLADLQKQNADLRAALDRANNDLRNIGTRVEGLQIGALDNETATALGTLADQFSDIMSFDAARGMVRFNSDLTFDSGSAVVKAEARRALGALAQIINSSAAQQYDVIVEGHTDSQRISNPATLREHKTNRGLSVNRSISVIDTLAGMGVPNNRLMAAGWGEYRPSTTNTPSGNTPANRRVEIYFAKRNAELPAMPASTPAQAPATRTTPAPTKVNDVDLTK